MSTAQVGLTLDNFPGVPQFVEMQAGTSGYFRLFKSWRWGNEGINIIKTTDFAVSVFLLGGKRFLCYLQPKHQHPTPVEYQKENQNKRKQNQAAVYLVQGKWKAICKQNFNSPVLSIVIIQRIKLHKSNIPWVHPQCAQLKSQQEPEGHKVALYSCCPFPSPQASRGCSNIH